MTPTRSAANKAAAIYTDDQRDTVRANALHIAEACGGGRGLILNEKTVTVEYYHHRTAASPTGLEVELGIWHRVGENQWTLRRARGYTSIHSAVDARRTHKVKWKLVTDESRGR